MSQPNQPKIPKSYKRICLPQGVRTSSVANMGMLLDLACQTETNQMVMFRDLQHEIRELKASVLASQVLTDSDLPELWLILILGPTILGG